MSKLQHTPGPWKYTVSKIHHRHQISDFKCGGQICLMWNRGKDITEANARLIAAAPEMLEELINFCRYNCSGCPGMTKGCSETCGLKNAKAIIEKITGLTIEEVLSEISF